MTKWSSKCIFSNRWMLSACLLIVITVCAMMIADNSTQLMAQTQKPIPQNQKSVPKVKSCGGIVHNPCDRGEYCDITVLNSCDGADLPGTCKLLPRTCTADMRPVCGCDGKTYNNDCNRLIAQVQKAYDGQCRVPAKTTTIPSPKQCGGIVNQPCDKGQYCDITVLEACNGADLPGICKLVPAGCADHLIYQVCGCDGKTYDNDCYRLMAQVQKSHDGRCSRQRDTKEAETEPAPEEAERKK
ncbi:MAG: hypothetical protein A2Y62_02790 [Candidatus Fischerbacteria bacterium RBG_13_37_8]|uniref:Kazal-like domain-containing protein n=1 Tax=Candidatus Fischerbacteria bacterium RBG_13_37_8 TaxID=1817863 RepID=A0A1F5VY30_9BACT|nr:MAG: hypothetical protein A2Y62_02790 [Candidatus Fischerbacteria bacterium RBG_13_37_8]